MALLEQAAGQGHAYAMHTIGCIHDIRNAHEQAVTWYTKGAEAGVPKSQFNLGVLLDAGKGVAAPDYPAAADWYRRAADAGFVDAMTNLATMYTVGRGRAGQNMSASFDTLVPWMKWHYMTRRAISAWPWRAASRGASGGRFNGGVWQRIPATPTRACNSPLSCTETFPTPARLGMSGRPPGPPRRLRLGRGTTFPRMS
jgi:TPR repeat protein